jgi:hypothetical protein
MKLRGEISAGQLATGTAEVNREIAALNARIAAAAGASSLEGMPGDVDAIREWFGRQDISRRRVIIAEHFEWVRIMSPTVRGRPRGSRQSDGYFDRSAVVYRWR